MKALDNKTYYEANKDLIDKATLEGSQLPRLIEVGACNYPVV